MDASRSIRRRVAADGRLGVSGGGDRAVSAVQQLRRRLGARGRLYVTGHDTTEVYVLERPVAGATLRLVTTLEFPGQGQGIAWDPSAPTVLYGIRRAERMVVWARLQDEGE